MAWSILAFILGYFVAYIVQKRSDKKKWYKIAPNIIEDLTPVEKGQIIEINKTAQKMKEATSDLNLDDVIDLE